MPIRLCLTAACPDKATYRGRCQRHAKQRNTDTHRNRKIYNSKRWKHTREAVLADQPLCPCGQIATDVHHKVDLEDGGDPWARANLEALCHACHSTITRGRQHA
jgi:5-methylcytosine-specific restriction endonuclease McrA